jgi:hypothetical protein
MCSTDRSLRVAALLAAALSLASVAFAGPPLICHPFMTSDGAPLLPWAEGNQWRQPDQSYDRATLVADMLRLLSPDAPILDRMENMRRAAIYADEDPRRAAALLMALVERAKTMPADTRAEALAWFDAGYLVETYRQLGLIYAQGMLPSHGRWTSLVPASLGELDGYALVQRAVVLAPESQAELDFASALMSSEPRTASHLRRAASSASAGSLLAKNLVHYDVR